MNHDTCSELDELIRSNSLKKINIRRKKLLVEIGSIFPHPPLWVGNVFIYIGLGEWNVSNGLGYFSKGE